MRIGYARVSTDEQSLDLQLDALKKAGCKRVFTDKASAAKGERPGLADAVSHLRSGDVLVIWKLDRLGRTVKGLVELVADLQERGIQFRSLTDGIDTTTPAGRFFFHVMASLSQMERELLAERTCAGLDAARRRGRVGGRKRRMTPGEGGIGPQAPEGRYGPSGRGPESRCLDPDALSLGSGDEPMTPFELDRRVLSVVMTQTGSVQ
jgi:DNA invertase Pin-like site-specific DNA recombinase